MCDFNAIKVDDGLNIDRELCNGCGKCAEICKIGAIEVFGTDIDVNTVMDIVERDSVFYKNSGGGITVSGGEPYFQPEFLISLISSCRERKIGVAIDTSGYTAWNWIQRSLDFVDVFLYDLKDYDRKRHKLITGVDNHLILSNLRRLTEVFPVRRIVVRVPVIPKGNFYGRRDFEGYLNVLSETGIERIDVLPYHSLARDKYRVLGRDFVEFGSQNLDELTDGFVEYLIEHGFEVTKRGYF